MQICLMLLFFGLCPRDVSAQVTLHPMKAAKLSDGVVVVADRDSGTVSLVDWKQEKVLVTEKIGESIVDVQAIGDATFLALDHINHELIHCMKQKVVGDNQNRENIIVTSRVKVSPYPIRVTAAPSGRSGRWCLVSSLWSRKLSAVQIVEDRIGQELRTIELPFAPRCVLHFPAQKAIFVADAFAGRLAVVDYKTKNDVLVQMELQAVRKIPGHNVSALAVSDDQLLITQMVMSRLVPPKRDEVHWGNYIASSLRTLSISGALFSKPAYRGNVLTLGDTGRGFADPSALVVDGARRRLVAFAGTNQIAVFDRYGNLLSRVKVGKRPTDLLQVDEDHFMTVNAVSNSLSVIKLEEPEPGVVDLQVKSIDLAGDRRAKGMIQRGEELFYSAELSHDGWMSCHSCHTEGHTSELVVDTMGDGAFGAPKRVLSLRGIDGTLPLAWNGTVDYESQVKKSVAKTMHGKQLSDKDTRALTAFLKSLPRAPKQADLRPATINIDAITRGKNLFQELNCSKCHAGPKKTSADIYDVGLRDAVGNKKFNPPSLVGVLHRDRFFHDNRAQSLTEVFGKYSHPGDTKMTDTEASDLIAYLNSL